ncbi:MAG: hypothetical protein NZO16_07060, partial [Deltaproteobacteria bacterium]|nr:hypothetical protein [Deltaproteobacteria bacterium]
MTKLDDIGLFTRFSYEAINKATDFLTNLKTQDPQGSKVDVGLDDEIKRLVLPETLSEVASLEKHGGDPELVNFQAILIDRLNRALKFCEFYLKNLSTLENYSGGLGGVILEMNRQLEVIFSENPEIRRLLAEWGDFEQKAVNPNVSVEEREKALKETLKLLEKGGKDLYRAVVLADHLAQITEVLKDYTEKVGPLSPRIVPEYSLKELIFKE